MIFIVFVAWLSNLETQNKEFATEYGAYPVLVEGFSQEVDGAVQELEHIEMHEEVDAGEALVFQYVLPEILGSKYLMFYSVGQEVSVKVSLEEIYSFEKHEEFEMLVNPGNKWNLIELTEDMSGEVLEISLCSAEERYCNYLPDIFYVEKESVLGVVIHANFKNYLMILALAALVITSYVNGYLWKHDFVGSYDISLGHMYLFFAMWLCFDTNFSYVMLENTVLFYVGSRLIFYIIPVVTGNHMRCSFKGRSKVIDLILTFVCLNFIALTLLEFVVGVPAHILTNWNHACILVSATGCIICVLTHFFKRKEHSLEDYLFYSNAILFVGIIMETITYYTEQDIYTYIGRSLLIFVTMHLLVANALLVKIGSRAEEECTTMQTTTLNQQIKAHFLHNTLNAISALCKTDASAADRAIRLFSKYMRKYMILINTRECITFESELELVDTYLAVEKLRFMDKFEVNFEISCTDFKIPPLTLQPLVENALVHGFNDRLYGGVITIVCEKKGKNVQVLVKDNGAGFELSLIEEKESLALKNIKKRLEFMAHGTIRVESVVGEGTTVVIDLPANV
ncbi:MAG: histidine kinase [Lachnospiraceae bacterium]